MSKSKAELLDKLFSPKTGGKAAGCVSDFRLDACPTCGAAVVVACACKNSYRMCAEGHRWIGASGETVPASEWCGPCELGKTLEEILLAQAQPPAQPGGGPRAATGISIPPIRSKEETIERDSSGEITSVIAIYIYEDE